METDRKPIVVIAGPTAVGKSEIAAELGRMTDGEVVSADSMQVYRHLDIGTAKTSREEMLGVPHHLIDVADPDEAFHVVRYQALAKKAVREIQDRGNLPILCGGTGFYLQAVLYDIDYSDSGENVPLREELNAYADQYGNEALFRILKEEDPLSSVHLHPNNRKRVIRAIEYFRSKGEPIALLNEREARKESPYACRFYVITDDRDYLYRKIDARVDFMIEAGLIEEVRYLLASGLTREHLSMQGIGYKETAAYLDGELSYEEYLELLKRNTRHYAKRQLTWFRRERNTIWLDRRDYGRDSVRLAEHIRNTLSKEHET